MSESAAVGIDLGTTCSSIAYLKKNGVTIIANNNQSYYTPSTVYFGDDEIRVGEEIKDIHDFTPHKLIFNAKRLIGRKFDDFETRRFRESLANTYNIVNYNNRPGIQVPLNNKQLKLEPEVISCLVLKELRRLGSNHLGKDVTKAVITVPAYFNDSQRQGTIDAARLAGLEVLRIINEPTAAAIAYADGNLGDSDEKVNLLVFDLGGGTFDVTILSVERNKYQVLATGGNTFLGGEDFDNRLVNHFITQLRNENNFNFASIDDETTFVLRLRIVAKLLKVQLTTRQEATNILERGPKGKSVRLSITRAQYENLCRDLFQLTLDTVDQVLKDSGLGKNSEINHVVLAGGSSRTPYIKTLLENRFPGSVNQDINPEEAVVTGAALLAARLGNLRTAQRKPNFELIDVTPLSLGFEDAQDEMHRVIGRNSALPANGKALVATSHNNQTVVDFPIYQGEDSIARNNHLLQNFRVEGIPPRPVGSVRITITFDIDLNGVLHVRAHDLQNNWQHELRIAPWNQTYSIEANGENRNRLRYLGLVD
ncbi:uncharacterized protein SAPINGB_P006404 [Magnusiomyces paraingens]|uniref:Uncharacterized protein n=1 Tax=Magnusiomyces paraingens TaxID=2606893 RepID=A0A5E8C5P3_9ASCO|nr:uncharacterized protein SAPINGB_P006404 [Saprochaete ingens]VVT58827.1 unnamed protein product [Saprochaete ingens]